MPGPDFFTIAMVVAINLMVIAIALPWLLDQKLTYGARHAQRYFLLQGLAWLAGIAELYFDTSVWGKPLSTIAILCATLVQWELSRSLSGWLGPRHRALDHSLRILSVIGVLGYLVTIHSPAQRLAWFSTINGMCAVLVGCMALFPRKPQTRVWRYIVFSIEVSLGLAVMSAGLTQPYESWAQMLTADSGLHPALGLMTPICGSLLMLATLWALREELKRNQNSRPDDWAGLPQRKALERQGQAMLERAQRDKLPLAFVMLDMDHFYRVNQERGYAVGDEALQLLSRILQKHIRCNEVIARWQGQALCMLLHADAAGVQSLCARLQSAMQLGAQYELQVDLSFSAGCALVPEVWEQLSIEDLARHAENALQDAKRLGRGRWEFVTLQVAEIPLPRTMPLPFGG
ncbi:MAG: GGDEF domain-containing protein [Comamonas sp.]